MQPIIPVHINQIKIDPALQPRVDGIDPEHVRELEAVAEHWPPLKVAKQAERYLLIDGFHRFAAAQNLKLDTIAVELIEASEADDLHALAFALNATHGRPLTLSDRRAFAAHLLRRHPNLADREIGRRCGLVQPTVAKVRDELERGEAIPVADTRVGRDGRNYAVAKKSTPTGAPQTLGEVLGDLFSPAERRAQRKFVRYLEQLAEALEQQDDMPSFETFEQAAKACQEVLGVEGAKELSQRLGWSAGNVFEIARALGYREQDAS